MLRIASLTAVIVIFSVSFCEARRIVHWNYDKLFKESDLIVIASPQSTAANTVAAGPEFTGLNVIGQRTSFKIMSIIKGDSSLTTCDLDYFAFGDSNGGMADPPWLASFRTAGLKVEIKDDNGLHVSSAQLGKPDYLLFMKKGENGAFVPVTGQFDSIFSIREITIPMLNFRSGN